jgi:hypothetical protein
MFLCNATRFIRGSFHGKRPHSCRISEKFDGVAKKNDVGALNAGAVILNKVEVGKHGLSACPASRRLR